MEHAVSRIARRWIVAGTTVLSLVAGAAFGAPRIDVGAPNLTPSLPGPTPAPTPTVTGTAPTATAAPIAAEAIEPAKPASPSERPPNADELERRARKQQRGLGLPSPVHRRLPHQDGKPYANVSKSSAGPATPSPFFRMWTGTKNFFKRTGEAITPKSQSQPTYRRSSQNKKPASKGPGSWWRKKEEPQPSKTLSDFFNQQRPS